MGSKALKLFYAPFTEQIQLVSQKWMAKILRADLSLGNTPHTNMMEVAEEAQQSTKNLGNAPLQTRQVHSPSKVDSVDCQIVFEPSLELQCIRGWVSKRDTTKIGCPFDVFDYLFDTSERVPSTKTTRPLELGGL